MKPMLAIARAVLSDAIKRKVVWVIALFAGLLVFAVPSLPSYDNIVVGSVYREVTYSLMFLAALSVGLALACTRLPAEIERRTLFSVLARDVRRWQYIAATWLGIFAVVGIAVAAFVVIAIFGGWVLYQHEIMLTLVGAAFAVWLETGVIIAVALLTTSRFGSVTALVASLAFLFIGHSWESAFATSLAKSSWLPSLEVFNVIDPVAYANGVTLQMAIPMTMWFLAAVALLLWGASASFSARDL